MKKERKKRAAIYARVSTIDKGQDPEAQLLQLREYAERRDFIWYENRWITPPALLSKEKNIKKCLIKCENEK